MPPFSIFVAASAFAALVATKPLPQAVPTKKGFTINQSIAKPFLPGPVQVQKAYKKFNVAVPADVAAAAAADDGSVAANPEQYDAEYLSPVTIGGQTLNLDFDTGSADLFVTALEVSMLG
jgi:aspergillopepsin I